MPSGKVTAGDGSRPSKGVHGNTVSDSEVVKRLMREVDGLTPDAKKEFSAYYIGWALSEEERLNKEAKKKVSAASKGKSKAISSKVGKAGVKDGLSYAGAAKGDASPPTGNKSKYASIPGTPVQVTPVKTPRKRCRPSTAVMRPLDGDKLSLRSSKLTALSKTANEYFELGLGGSPSKKQRTKSPEKIDETEMPEEMMEAAASPAEEILATPLAEEEEILSDGERSDWTTIPTSREERAKKEEKKQKKKEEKAATSGKNEEKKPRVQPIIGVNLPRSVYSTNHLTFIKWTRRMNIKVSETRRTMAKDLLIFPETEEDSKKIYESLKREDSGLVGTSAIFRPPKKSAEAKVEDSLSVVVKDVDTKAEEEDIEAAIMEEQRLKVKVVRFINRSSGRGIPKVKVTFEKKEEMEAATKNSRLLIGTHSYRTEEYKKKTRILQCYRCQRFGHAQDSCKARDVRCGKCAGPHKRAECTARASYCANCTGDHLASDGRCPRAIEVKKKIAEKREGQRHRGTQATNKKPAPAQHQRQSKRAEQPEQPKKAARGELPDLPLLNLSDNDLTRVALFISAHTILYARAMNAGTMEPDDVPHIASKSVNWAFRANVSPLTIRDYLLHLPKDL